MYNIKNRITLYNKEDLRMDRGIGDITPEWIEENIIHSKCHYCGREYPEVELGCDRINNNLPHTKSNCVPCCFDCNRMKFNKDYSVFMSEVKYWKEHPDYKYCQFQNKEFRDKAIKLKKDRGTTKDIYPNFTKEEKIQMVLNDFKSSSL